MTTAIVAMSASVLVACGEDLRPDGTTTKAGDLTISNAFIGTYGSQIAAGYLTIDNPGPADQLVSISSPGAERIGHMGTMSDVSSTETTTSDPIPIPADGLLELSPGGAHLMIELHEPLAPGDTLRLRLTFERAPAVQVTATAVDVADIPDIVSPEN